METISLISLTVWFSLDLLVLHNNAENDSKMDVFEDSFQSGPF